MSEEIDGVFYDAIMLSGVDTKEAAISQLADSLSGRGYVSESYSKATRERELLYPTGLPTKPFAIAVPHSEKENVIREAVLLGVSDNPITFAEMGNSDSLLGVRVVFLLALKGENNQVNYLRSIVNYCKVEQKLIPLGAVTSSEEACRILIEDVFQAR